uniref:Uncharacterized protein n=1 Tax=Cacopsylla melanoneura TaxID=428564 RepID=A0A8D8RX76_9HEMI
MLIVTRPRTLVTDAPKHSRRKTSSIFTTTLYMREHAAMTVSSVVVALLSLLTLLSICVFIQGRNLMYVTSVGWTLPSPPVCTVTRSRMLATYALCALTVVKHSYGPGSCRST